MCIKWGSELMFINFLQYFSLLIFLTTAQLQFMEMDVCGSNEAEQIGESLTSFFHKMSGGDDDDKPAPAAPPKRAPPVTRAPPPQRSSIPSRSNPNDRYNATSGASRRQQEMSSMFGSGSSGGGGGGGGGMSVKDRMKMFNNNQKFECDPTAFALNLNKQEKGELCLFGILLFS